MRGQQTSIVRMPPGLKGPVQMAEPHLLVVAAVGRLEEEAVRPKVAAAHTPTVRNSQIEQEYITDIAIG